MIEVEVAMVRFDQEKIPIVILREKEGRSKRFLPIWIGIFEAVAIIMELEKQPVERPMTHDLLKSIIDNLGASVISILVSELKNDTFYAEISLRLSDGKVVKVDSRPSDAMALALRANAPIYVSEEVMSKSGISPDIMEADEKDELKAFLDSLKPEDFESKV
ncbi:MAG: bifunctional nuclease family protein [bacterium]